MHAAPAIVILFVIAAVVAVVARKVRVPYTVALVVAGLAFNALHLVQPPHLTKDLLYTLFLPGLVFEAAFAIELGRFKQSRGLILGLALPGLCVGIAVTTFLLLGLLRVTGAAPDLPIGTILVFSALICATDPIAVIALFKQLGAPKRLAVLVESESLLNDGTAAIAFTIVVDAVVGGTTDVGHGLAQFVVVVGAGLAIGAVVGGAASFLMRWIDDAMIETTLTTIAAYGSFVFAEHFHFSGILATVVAGVVCGSYGAPRGMSPTTRLAVATFWEYLAFALNSLVFLMIGFEVRIADVVATGGITLLAYVAVTVGRALVVGAGAAIALRTKERIPWGWAAVVSWGGLRGALSMVLVLGLPAGLPGRDLLINVTFGVVTLSILLQGTSMSFLLRALGLARSSAQSDQEHPVAELRAARAASKELAKMRAEGLRDEIADELAREYEKRIESTVGATSAVGDADRVAAERRAALRRLALVEKDAVVAALRSGLIGEDTHHHVRQEIDARLHDLEDEH